jgi:hypothetical protein
MHALGWCGGIPYTFNLPSPQRITMPRPAPLLPLALIASTGLLMTSLLANASALYKCVDDAHHTTYTTSKTPGNCTLLSSGSVASPRASTSSGTSTARPHAATTPSPSDFPRVSGDAQKSRDSDRKRILEQEFAAEQRNYDDAKRQVSEQEQAKAPADRLQPLKDRQALHERNLAALKKEIGNLR